MLEEVAASNSPNHDVPLTGVADLQGARIIKPAWDAGNSPRKKDKG
jgi:hypothetical protein